MKSIERIHPNTASSARQSVPRSILALGLVVLALGAVGCGTTIPSGHKGVFFAQFGGGTEMGHIYEEGFNWHLPWNSYFVYRTQLQESKEQLAILSSDGATVTIDVSLLFRIDPLKVDSLQLSIGPNYYNDAVAPTLRGEARSIIGRYKPEEIYSGKRDAIAEEVTARVKSMLIDKFVSVENVIIRDVILPQRISDAINAKLEADQQQQAMTFVLMREKQEAERKRFEAQGISDFQKIVSSGLNPALLTWKGIEATQALATSPNAKIVVVGNSKNGLPLILGGNE